MYNIIIPLTSMAADILGKEFGESAPEAGVRLSRGSRPVSKFLRTGLPWFALVCPGPLWFALVCPGPLWFALVCPGPHVTVLNSSQLISGIDYYFASISYNIAI